ncbi:MAG TPA: glycosyltransferase family 39 protein [Chloroflexota bacterium]|nr:glycosyltransferase family 39 protein [Chloroflexota bacterium]HUM70548.1 glycosyltransferase family 39 protein [Chloroflexota bacterium]
MRIRAASVLTYQPLLMVSLILLIAVALRYAYLERRVYWHDEVYTSLRAAGYTAGEVINTYFDGQAFAASELVAYQHPTPDKSWGDALRSMAFADPHLAPIYFLISRAWMLTGGSSPGAMRAMTVVISLLAIPAAYWLAFALFRQRAIALIMLCLMSVSPMFILLAREARPYSLWTLLTLVSSAAFLDAMRLGRKANWALYAMTLALGINTHLFFSLVMLAHATYFLLAFLPQSGIERPVGKTVKAYLVANLAGLLTFIPWVVATAPYVSRVSQNTSWAAVTVPLTYLIRLWIARYSGVFVDLDLLPIYVQLLFVTPVLLLVLYSFAWLWKNGPPQARLFVILLAIIPASIFVIPDLLFDGIRSTVARYLVPLFISLQLAMAYLLACKLRLSIGLSRTIWRGITITIILLGLISSIYAVRANAWWDKGSDYGFHEVATIINTANHPLVIVGEFRYDLFGATLALSNELEPHVQMLWTTAVEPEEINGYDPVFVFRPTPAIQQSVEFSKEKRLEPVILNLLWQITAKEQ